MDEVKSIDGLNPELTVTEVLERWPETVSAFQRLKTACVGCTMAPFDTLRDVASIYQFELEEVMGAMREAIADGAEEDV
ncbi:MAG: hypothetical protein R3248_10800 [Candidatus Promineifilaceae bacterium]|nr:hypothetical protein [Candidatus Promineifilaceae bacterium]